MTKKRNLLSFLFALIFLPCLFLFTACGDEPPARTLSSISVTVPSHSHFDGGSQFTYNYGETIEISKSDFSVTAHYSDNTYESVTDFNLDLSSIPQGTVPAGTYYITISYQEQTSSFSVVVNTQQLNLSSPVFDFPVYSGAEINITEVAEISAFMLENNLKVSQSSQDATQTNAGSYVLTLDSNDASITGTFDIQWQIEKKPIKLSDFLVFSNLTRNGDDNNVYETTYSGASFTLSSSASFVTVSNSNSYSNAGDYFYYFTTDENHKFSTSSNEYTTTNETYLDLTLRIHQVKLSFNKTDIVVSDVNRVYTGTAFTLNQVLGSNFETFAEYFKISVRNGDLTNAGDNDVVLSPKENIPSNYAYKNGDTITSEEINLTFTITKADPNYNGVDTQNNVTFEVTYSEHTTYSSILDKIYLTENSITFLTENLSFSDFAVFRCAENECDDILSAGTCVKEIFYTPNSNNYNFARIAVTVVVNRAEIIINTTWYLDNNNFPTNNFLTYNTEAHEASITLSSNYDVTATLQTFYKQLKSDEYGTENVESAVNAGFYKTVATFNYDNFNKNYIFTSFDSDQTFETLEKEWQIKKATYTGSDVQWAGITFNVWSDTVLYQPENAITLSASLEGSQASQFEVAQILVQHSTTQNGTYSSVLNTNIKEVGFYTAQVSINCLTGNYDVQLSDQYCKEKFEIIPSTIDCSDVHLAIEGKTYTKAEWLASFSDSNNWLTNANGKGLAFDWYITDQYGNMNTEMINQLKKGVAGTYIVRLNSANKIDSYQNSDLASLINDSHLNPANQNDRLEVMVTIAPEE